MTNFEKYKDEILELTKYGDVGISNGIPCSCDKIPCNTCDLDGKECACEFVRWLYEEYKEPAPKLTKRERAFCEIADRCLNEIYRTTNGDLYLEEDADGRVRINNEYFQFIKPNESYMVSNLLKLEVE